ncbi:MAG TPA: hypothetical protein VFB80_21655 [Pirellulaceae bacterium]|nr:hypothetical protein [Pirellulaceae bacterium]
MERERLLLNPALIGVLLLGMLAAAYISGYTLRCRVVTVMRMPSGPATVRTYPSWLEAQVYSPGGYVESLATGQVVYVGHR